MKNSTNFNWAVRGLSLAIAGGAVMSIGVSAQAQPGPDASDRGPGRFIERADTNGDGNVTLEEMNAMHAKQTAEHFARMDSNGDGVINSDDPRPEPRRDGDMGPRGERPDAKGDRGSRGDRPRGGGDFGPRGDRPRPEGDVGPRSGGPRGDGEFGRRGAGPRGDRDAGPRGDRGHSIFMEKADTDGDGGVSLAELQAVRPDATEEDFQKRDVNGDGVLNRDDRQDKHASRRGGHSNGAEGRGDRGPRGHRGPEAMMKADTDEDGNITLEEFQAASAEAAAKRFSEHDTNNDGVLNKEDRPEGGREGRGGRGNHGPHGARQN